MGAGGGGCPGLAPKRSGAAAGKAPMHVLVPFGGMPGYLYEYWEPNSGRPQEPTNNPQGGTPAARQTAGAPLCPAPPGVTVRATGILLSAFAALMLCANGRSSSLIHLVCTHY